MTIVRFFNITMIVLLLCALPNCSYKKTKKIIEKKEIKTNKPMPFYFVKIKIEGIECEVCAQSIIKILQAIDGIKNPSFQGHFEGGVVTYYWCKNEPLALSKLTRSLQKEGFALVQFQGPCTVSRNLDETGNNICQVNALAMDIFSDNAYQEAIDEETWKIIEAQPDTLYILNCTFKGNVWRALFDLKKKVIKQS